ncbi:MAG: hypothetical protein F9K36_04300 [Burkholderiaceae bacterium]|nr:MAG: hypothetical protein F9K36_04300 [Burkholderiaceae bacterium]
MSTESIHTLARAAQASYEALSAGDTRDTLAAKLQTERGGFTLTQATRFAAEQSVVVQYNDDAAGTGTQGTSLSVTVFKDSAGNVTLAIRGTLEAPGDFTPTDAPYIALGGAAYDQIAALYSWWLRRCRIAPPRCDPGRLADRVVPRALQSRAAGAGSANEEKFSCAA